MLVGMAASFATHVGLLESRWVLFGASAPLSVIVLDVSLRAAGIEFGSPELSCEQHVGEMVKALPALALVGFTPPLQVAFPAMDFPVLLLQAAFHLVTGLNVRGAGLVVLFLARPVNAAWVLTDISPSEERGALHIHVSLGLSVALGIWTKYFHDQRLAFCIGHMQLVAGTFFYRYFVTYPSVLYQISLPFILALMCFLTLLFQRRLRNLPPVLDAIKFTRLGFIRGSARCSGPILRCQSMPACAFGDVRKARTLIAVSHRWLDRDTCDVQTPAFPMGLHLGTMRRILNTHFGPTRAEQPSFARRLRHVLGRRAMGGWDLVVFFDFTGLPQEPRSEEEERAFRQCLPHMGMLYSMFPTMVLHEVTLGTHGFLESGWCFCEFQTAKLGKQLSTYSRDAIDALSQESDVWSCSTLLARYSSGGDDCTEEDFISQVQAELEQKHFLNPTDTEEVRRIISAFALKRVMLDAIEGGSMEQLRSAVSRLRGQQLAQSTLDQPVNKALETLLHVAVRKGNAAATKFLLDSGASPARRNLRGDVPAQCFMLPRCGEVASLCRTVSPLDAAGAEVTGRATAAADVGAN